MAAGGDRQALGQWVQETKFDQWARILPVLRSLEIDGLDVAQAETQIVPLAEKLGFENVHDTAENAQMFVANRMAAGGGGPFEGWSAATVLFGAALLLPVVLALWIAVRAVLTPADAGAAAQAMAEGGASGEV